MRALLAAFIFALAFRIVSAGNLPPLTAKDIGLMLRSGYSSDAVEREVAARHFLGTVDAATEKKLVEAGASPRLIAGLKAGSFAVPASELNAVKTELAAKAQRRAEQLEESRKLDTLYQAELARKQKAAAAAGPVGKPNTIASLVKGELVTSRNGVLRPHLDAEFEKKKLIGLYYAGFWCPQCRKFTPKLVAFYNRIAAAHPEFEILFVSHDKSATAMESYMRDAEMPWPAVNFEKIAANEALRKYAGPGVPCLVVVDESGKVISDSFSGKDYRGPDAVVADLEKMFAGDGGPSQLAQTR
jgi:nucleoredoxin